MRFMLFVQIPNAEESDWDVKPEDAAAMSRYNEELSKAGVLLALDGLQPPSKGARVHFSDTGRPTVVDGPFTEAKEVVGGYWIIQAKSKDEAVEWAKRCPMGPGAFIEVRQIFEMSDFSEDVQAATTELSPPDQTTAS